MSNDDIFREIADQLRPSPEVRAELLARIDAEPTGSGPAPEPAERRRRRLPAWGAAVAAITLAVAVAAVPGLLGRQAGTSDQSPAHPAPTSPASGYVGGTGDYSPVHDAVAAGIKPMPQGVTSVWGMGATQVSLQSAEDSVASWRQAAPVSGTWNTNAQVSGIDEGDLVKSDGHTIFVASGATVRLVSADGAGSTELSRIDTAEQAEASTDGTVQGPVAELMLYGTTLVALVTDYTPHLNAGAPTREPIGYLPYLATETRALLYDVSDPNSPRFLTALGQSGAPVSSRLSGDILYLVSQYVVADADAVRADDPSTFVPLVSDARGTTPLNAADIMLMPEPQEASYTVISSIDLSDNRRIDAQTVLSGAQSIYLAQDNLYLASVSDGEQPITGFADDTGTAFTSVITSTDLARVAVDDGELTAAAEGSVPGSVLNQFALDEFDGQLRVAVTMSGNTSSGWATHPALIVLDRNLKTVGILPKLAENETIQSVRFSGDVAYVVSFRQVDPLFAIDLSDPTAPSVMSELKIPGFSTYLHPWSDRFLLGLGMDGTDNGLTGGLKLSMFNTADPFAVTEAATLKVPFGDSEALRNHKAVLVDQEQGLIGFSAWSYGTGSAGLRYLVYRWDGTAFALLEDLQVGRASAGDPTSGQQAVRGLTIDDHLYVVSGSGVDVYAAGPTLGGEAVKVAAEQFGDG